VRPFAVVGGAASQQRVSQVVARLGQMPGGSRTRGLRGGDLEVGDTCVDVTESHHATVAPAASAAPASSWASRVLPIPGSPPGIEDRRPWRRAVSDRRMWALAVATTALHARH
jgi:hypothetical protein